MKKREVKLYDFEGKLFKAIDLVITNGEMPDVITVKDRIFVASFSKYSYTERTVYQYEPPLEPLAKQSVTETIEERTRNGDLHPANSLPTELDKPI